ncbi:Cleft lip and palate transmembrane protein 1 (CLPTM1) [Novymonas esmeraldas]|uniref:Cleft lip and palate transmembrane protein 1 (CLPTM1) n=1 Tax=Novymonas esmeraldas TaxID=1808958 RepID=A0AAW0EV15_9TRYP
MPDAGAQRGQGGNNGNQGSWWSFLSNAAFYVVFSLVISNVLFSKPPAIAVENTTAAAAPESVTTPQPALSSLRPLARFGERFSVVVETQPPLFEPLHFDKLFFNHDALEAANISVTVPVDLAPCTATNCTVTVNVQWTLRNYSFSSTAPLVRFFKSTSAHQRYLFGNTSGGDDNDAAEVEAVAVRQYFQPELTLSPVVFFDHPLPDPCFEFTPVVESRPGFYGPSLYINNFWVLREHHVELNASSASQPLNFTVRLAPVPRWKALLFTQFEKTMSAQSSMGLSKASEAEETKRMLLDVSTKNPVLLAVTAIVTLLHSVFEFLAFSNDVKFWKGRKDFRGLSVRSIVINCYFQSIIFLYLLDSTETSWAVLVPSGMGALMEYWKLAKTIKVVRAETEAAAAPKATRARGGWRIAGYEIGFNDSYDSRTQKHDDVAVRYLMYAMLPLLTGYAAYSAVYKTHRNWYSFLVSTQVQFIYSFGFAQMTPQIFINYKMKSVGQLPWRTFIYKSLNTVIDDLFAFVIKMPWLHRLACFQDDVVFAILLYQRWIYPVDMSRFDGESGADDAEDSAPAAEQVAEAEKKNQ